MSYERVLGMGTAAAASSTTSSNMFSSGGASSSSVSNIIMGKGLTPANQSTVPISERLAWRFWRANLGLPDLGGTASTESTAVLNRFHAARARTAELAKGTLWSVPSNRRGTLMVWWFKHDPDGAAAWDKRANPAAPIRGSKAKDSAVFAKAPRSFAPAYEYLKTHTTLSGFAPSAAVKNAMLGLVQSPPPSSEEPASFDKDHGFFPSNTNTDTDDTLLDPDVEEEFIYEEFLEDPSWFEQHKNKLFIGGGLVGAAAIIYFLVRGR